MEFQNVNNKEIDTLARTVYGEARNQGRLGMAAVASVIMNRVRAPGWWGNDIISVCRKPSQFSCWNEKDPSRNLLETNLYDDRVFRDALTIAEIAANGLLLDSTRGATHYHTKNVKPEWAKKATVIGEIKDHIFYRDVK